MEELKKRDARLKREADVIAFPVGNREAEEDD